MGNSESATNQKIFRSPKKSNVQRIEKITYNHYSVDENSTFPQNYRRSSHGIDRQNNNQIEIKEEQKYIHNQEFNGSMSYDDNLNGN